MVGMQGNRTGQHRGKHHRDASRTLGPLYAMYGDSDSDSDSVLLYGALNAELQHKPC